MPDDADSRERARRQYWQSRSTSGWRCPGCGRSRDEVDRVDVHHRDGNPNNNDPDNLIALCRRCHLGGRHDRDVDDEHLGPPEPRGTSPPTPSSLDPP
jgi:5-methylcytosine-specific restriction endonuclease McrA